MIDTSSELLSILTDETGTGALCFATSPSFTTGITTPKVTFSDADASPSAVGELLYDNTVSGIDDGTWAWYDDDEVKYIISFSHAINDGNDDQVWAYTGK